jgi:hypothetical protein
MKIFFSIPKFLSSLTTTSFFPHSNCSSFVDASPQKRDGRRFGRFTMKSIVRFHADSYPRDSLTNVDARLSWCLIDLVALSLLLSAVDEAVARCPFTSLVTALCIHLPRRLDGFSVARGKGNVGDVHGESAFLIVWEDRTPK